MRYGYIGYAQVLDGNRISLEKALKRKKADPDLPLSKQIKSLMKTALFQTAESIWRMTTVKVPGGMPRLPPAKPRGVKESPTLLASRLSDIFYTKNADYILANWKQLDVEKFQQIGKVSRRYGAAWQPIYDLVSDDPEVHIKLIRRLLKLLDYPITDNFSTVFCFGLVGLKKYKGLVAKCPKLLRPYLCLLPASIKEHKVALQWADKKKYLRVALNADLFAGEVSVKKPVLSKKLKIAYKSIKATWEHYYAGTFVPLCLIRMDQVALLPSLAKKCNVVIVDFDPLSGDQYKLTKPIPKPAPLPVDPPKKKKKRKK